MIFSINKSILKLRYSRINQSKCYFSNLKLKPPWNILFFGNDEFSIYSLKALINECRNGGTIGKLEICTSVKKFKNPVQLLAEKENLKVNIWPIEVPDNVFHTGFVVSFGHLIPSKIITKFPLGMINVHASLLPRWRGAAPIIYCLANGDVTSGVTIMRIKPKKFDTGEIISQKSIAITNDMYLPELHSKLGKLGADQLVECLKDLPCRIQNAQPQPLENITYAPKVDSNFPEIKWNKMSSVEIFNLERAVKGFLPITSIWNGEVIKLISIRQLNEINKDLNPGFVIYDSNLNLLKVSCCDNKFITVEKVKLYMRKEMNARDFYNGFLSKVSLDKRCFM